MTTGSAGNAVGSPTFSPPEGGFLTGEIIQRDRSSGQARADGWTQLGGCLQVVPLAAIRVQTANRVVSKCRRGTCSDRNYCFKPLNGYFSVGPFLEWPR